MTGPARSPSSPWVQNAQGGHDGGVTQSFQSTMSPSNSGTIPSATFTESSSPNYFGMAAPQPSGLSTQKTWSTLSQTQPLPSPKFPGKKDSVSAGLMNKPKTEPETNRLRREPTLHEFSPQMTSWSKYSPSHPLGNVSFGKSSGLGSPPAGKNSVNTAQGIFFPSRLLIYFND